MSNKQNQSPKTNEVKKNKGPAKEVAEKQLPIDNRQWLKVFKRYQFSIAIISLLFILGGIILAMADLFNSANDTSGFSESSAVINFDQKTIDQIRAIEKGSQQFTELPTTGRVNPFAN